MPSKNIPKLAKTSSIQPKYSLKNTFSLNIFTLEFSHIIDLSFHMLYLLVPTTFLCSIFGGRDCRIVTAFFWSSQFFLKPQHETG